MKLLGLISFITHNFSLPDTLKVLYDYTAVIWPKFEYSSVAWNRLVSQILINRKTHEESWQIYATLGLFHSIFPNHDSILNYLNSKSLYSNDNILMLYLFLIFLRTNSVTDIVGLRLPTKQVMDFFVFIVSNVSIISPSPWCATDANSIRRYLDICIKHTISPVDAFMSCSPT